MRPIVVREDGIAANRYCVTLGLALSLAALAGGCGGRGSSASADEGPVPATTEPVYLATALPCNDLGSDDASFTPLRVSGPGYSATIEPADRCRRQSSGADVSGSTMPRHWYSYLYEVPMPASGEVQLTPGNQPAATVDAAKFNRSHAATIYYVNCSEYYADCPEGPGFQGRLTSIEYFKDEDVLDAP